MDGNVKISYPYTCVPNFKVLTLIGTEKYYIVNEVHHLVNEEKLCVESIHQDDSFTMLLKMLSELDVKANADTYFDYDTRGIAEALCCLNNHWALPVLAQDWVQTCGDWKTLSVNPAENGYLFRIREG